MINRTKALKTDITKVNQIVDWYESRQLSIYKTAEKTHQRHDNGNTKRKTRGINKKAEKAIEKVESKAPLSERMNKTAEKAREGKQLKVLRRIFGKQPLRNVITKSRNFSEIARRTPLTICFFQHRTVQEKKSLWSKRQKLLSAT